MLAFILLAALDQIFSDRRLKLTAFIVRSTSSLFYRPSYLCGLLRSAYGYSLFRFLRAVLLIRLLVFVIAISSRHSRFAMARLNRAIAPHLPSTLIGRPFHLSLSRADHFSPEK